MNSAESDNRSKIDPSAPGLREYDPEFLSTLERGLSVLRVFDHEHPEMQLSEVAKRTGLSPAVARRCLNTLVKLGYVRKTNRRFVLTPEVLVFASSYLGSMNLDEVVAPSLQTVRDATGDSSSMAVLSGYEALYIVHVSTQRPIRVASGVGTRFPVHSTSLGRVLMAFQPDSVTVPYLERESFPAHTEFTILEPKKLAEKFALIRKRFYDVALNELDYGLISLSVPIFDAQGHVVAAINCSTSTTRTSEESFISERLPLLQIARRNIEGALRRWPFLNHSVGIA